MKIKSVCTFLLLFSALTSAVAEQNVSVSPLKSETGDGEYVDEFVFANNSAKLLAVYMFENLKFAKLSKLNQ